MVRATEIRFPLRFNHSHIEIFDQEMKAGLTRVPYDAGLSQNEEVNKGQELSRCGGACGKGCPFPTFNLRSFDGFNDSFC